MDETFGTSALLAIMSKAASLSRFENPNPIFMTAFTRIILIVFPIQRNLRGLSESGRVNPFK
jgi:hypothetical protein